MATIGRGVYATAVHEFFDGLRSYDVGRAVAVLAPDCALASPWGNATDAAGVEKVLGDLVADPVTRPSFSIRDVAGDGGFVRLTVSVSHRFGHAPTLHSFTFANVGGTIRDIRVE